VKDSQRPSVRLGRWVAVAVDRGFPARIYVGERWTGTA
jgi:hypothetical protein